MDKISIYVATHKKMDYSLPSIYKLCQVNATINGRWKQYIHDNDNIDNISKKNYCYCELTAQYDLWKHNKSEIKGLAHYRRFFSNIDVPSYDQFVNNKYSNGKIGQSIITEEQIHTFLNDYDVILQWPVNSFHTSAYENLTRYVFPKDIEVLISVIEKDYPEYKECLEYALSRTGISYFNMLITKCEIFDQYSTWLFDILGKVESKIDISSYDVQHKRIFGYLSEVLLNVYVDYHKLRIKHVIITELLEVPDNHRESALAKMKYRIKLVRCLWKRVISDEYKKYEYLNQLSAGKIRDRILSDYYKSCYSFYDVYSLMNSFKDFETTIQRLSVDEMDVPYIETVTRVGRNQVNNDGICIVNLLIDSDKDINTIISTLYDIYSLNYTLDIRIINTTDNSLTDIRDKSGKRCQIIDLFA